MISGYSLTGEKCTAREASQPARQAAGRYAPVHFKLANWSESRSWIRCVCSQDTDPGAWLSVSVDTSHCSTPEYGCVTSTAAHMETISEKILHAEKIKSAQLDCDDVSAESLLQVVLLIQSPMISNDVCCHLPLRVST